MCAYGCLIIREARKHGGDGWAAYDAQFRRIAAARPGTPWAALDPSLHASTFLATRTGTGTHCRHCAEADHQSPQCALAPVRASPSHLSEPAVEPSSSGCRQEQPRATSRPLPPPQPQPICTSWNRGKCLYHPSCTYRHICATCRRGPHQAKDCARTPADSIFRRPYPPAKPST